MVPTVFTLIIHVLLELDLENKIHVKQNPICLDTDYNFGDDYDGDYVDFVDLKCYSRVPPY